MANRKLMITAGIGAALAATYASWKASQWLEEWQLSRAARIHAARKKREQRWNSIIFRAKLLAIGCLSAGALVVAYRLRSEPLRLRPEEVVRTGKGATVVTIAY